ncbi:unnamed protein product [Caenorhabditis nigoni]
MVFVFEYFYARKKDACPVFKHMTRKRQAPYPERIPSPHTTLSFTLHPAPHPSPLSNNPIVAVTPVAPHPASI